MKIFHNVRSNQMIGLATSQLLPLQDTPPIATTDLLQTIDFWHGEIWPTCYKQLVFDMERFWHLVWVNLMSYKFSLFFFHIPLYNFQIFGIFINNFCRVAWNTPFKKWTHMGKKHLVKIPTQHVQPNQKKTGEYFSKMWGQMKNSIVNKMSHYMFIWSRVFIFFNFVMYEVNWGSSTRGMCQIWLQVEHESKISFSKCFFVKLTSFRKDILFKIWQLQTFSPQNVVILVFYF